jgi:hypothetical protein
METFCKVLNPAQRIICAAVYVGGDASQPDGQGDYAKPVEVFKALLSHVKNRAAMKRMHEGPNLAGSDIKVLCEYMTAKDGAVVGGAFVPPFTWLITARLSPELFAQVRAGKLRGLSMCGTGNGIVKP